MALVLADRVKETTTTTGQGTITLAGAVNGFQSFSTIGNGNTTYYAIAGQGTSEWEVGIGTYTVSGTTLSRDTVISNSLGTTAKISFSAGTKDVFVTYPAGKSIYVNDNNDISLDFSNATLINRISFQTSTVNGTTGIYALPNGTATAASWQATNAADPTNASKILIATNGSTDVQLVSGRNGTGTYLPLTFYTNGSEKVRLDTSGNFFVGTNSVPGSIGNSILYAAQGVTAINVSTTLPYFQTYNSNAGTDLKTWRLGGDSSGALVFQTVNDAYSSSTTRVTMDASGNITATANVTAYSDERYKTNWRNVISDFVYKLSEVRSGVYDRIDSGTTQAGVSAQSLKKILPEAVLTDENGMLSVAYGNAALVACIELAKELIAVRSELNDLKRRYG